jgi:hypothetical protein
LVWMECRSSSLCRSHGFVDDDYHWVLPNLVEGC